MNAEHYEKTWNQLRSERNDLADRRTTIETELSEINTKILHLEEVLSHLAPLAGIHYDSDNISALGITDATRFVLTHTSQKVSATEIRQALKEKGFDFSGITAQMASIYKVLSRLVESGQVERTEDPESGRVSFEWKNKDEVWTDDNIPF